MTTLITDTGRLEYRGRPPERELLPTAPRVGTITLSRVAEVEPDSIGEPGHTRVELVAPDGRARLLPRPIVYHSPTGFSWGYRGSGPADLAANILALFVSWKEAWRLHQAYKEDVVARIPDEGGRVDCRDVRLWLESYWKVEQADADLMHEEASGGVVE